MCTQYANPLDISSGDLEQLVAEARSRTIQCRPEYQGQGSRFARLQSLKYVKVAGMQKKLKTLRLDENCNDMLQPMLHRASITWKSNIAVSIPPLVFGRKGNTTPYLYRGQHLSISRKRSPSIKSAMISSVTFRAYRRSTAGNTFKRYVCITNEIAHEDTR